MTGYSDDELFPELNGRPASIVGIELRRCSGYRLRWHTDMGDAV
jgi:hypothetical protein